MLDIEYALWRLEGVFHNETHFQQEFALILNTLLEGEGGTVRLEWQSEEGVKIDLAIKTEENVVPIELKYKTREATVHDRRFDEQFSLSRQGAYDAGTYRFVRDITRIETVANEHGTTGYAIFLTNDPAYWTERDGAVYDPFRIYEGQTLSGTLDWIDEREWQEQNNLAEPLHLDHSYDLEWIDYAYRPDIDVGGADEFRVLPVRIPPNED